jgi:DNA topoisomerase-1
MPPAPSTIVNASLLDPRRAAAIVRLRYTTDQRPGIRRRRAGKGFYYLDPQGRRIRDPEVLERIRKLAIPPAYEGVWICPDEDGHVQATARDARGRKQYRYHARWREVRDANKYDRLRAFGHVLPRIRARVDAALRRPDLSRERVLALVVRLLDLTHIRVGNEEYARTNHSYGLTTMRSRHVELHGQRVRFSFRGKSGVAHEVTLSDRRIARALQRCLELPGQELFHYLDADGTPRPISSTDVNAYLHELTGAELTAKDFRTWAGTVLALGALRAQAKVSKRRLVDAIRGVAIALHNTPAVCRRCYIHPAVSEGYLAGELAALPRTAPRRHLSADETLLLRMLERRQTKARGGLPPRARLYA